MSDPRKTLQALTQMRLDAELAELRRLAAETRAHQDEIARLGAELDARAEAVRHATPEDDLAFAQGRDAAWQDWVAAQKRRLSQAAAEAAARREAQRKKARHAFGQVEALAALRKLDEEERRLKAARALAADPDRTGDGG